MSETADHLDVLPLCPARRDLPPGYVHGGDRREEDGMAGIGACMSPSSPTSLGHLTCEDGHVWPAVPRERVRKVDDPVGILYRDAAAQVEAWRRRAAREAMVDE